MKIKDIAEEERPRERIAAFGPKALSSAELLAIILKCGTRNENVIDLSNRLINEFGFESLAQRSLEELMRINGIGPAKASQIAACFELFRRFKPAGCKDKQKIACAEDVFLEYGRKIKGELKEHFIAIYLDSKNRIIKEETISIGILNQTIIHPREVFRGAIQASANSIIVIHNHPSGEPTPSSDDIKVTEVLAKAGEIIGITLLDHIIIGDTYHSFKESGEI